jgi:hypothetical protein
MSTSAITPKQENNHVVRERIFQPHQLNHVMQEIHESRATGVLMLDINQGGLCAIRFLEEKKITPP